MEQYTTYSEKETRELAGKLSQKIKSGVVALSGQLGAGKTTFVQGFAQGLGIKDKIISPTFVLIRQHKIPDSKGILFHIDLYRLEEAADIKTLGLEELFLNPEDVVLVEWAEKAKNIFPKNTITITIAKAEDSKRIITII